MLLGILIAVTIIAVGVLIAGVVTDDANAFGTGIFLALVVGCLGWGILGNVVTKKKVMTEITPDEIFVSQTAAIVEHMARRWTFTDVETYNLIKDSSAVFCFYQHYNMYGGECGTTLDVKSKNDK